MSSDHRGKMSVFFCLIRTMAFCWVVSSTPWLNNALHMFAIVTESTSCSQHLSNVVILVTVGLCLSLCESHHCPCRATLTSKGTNGLSWKRSTGHSTCHHQINDAIWWALKRANVPATKEPMGLLRGDGKHLDGLALVPWQSGPSVSWDDTVVDSLVSSYTPTTTN